MQAARRLDFHICPIHGSGPIIMPCCRSVLIGFRPAARITDLCICGNSMDMITQGSKTVMTGYSPQARVLDATAHNGRITTGCRTVIVGG